MQIVAHRAGNDPEAAAAAAAAEAAGQIDMVELDVHVLRGRVEVRHAKVARPTQRLWEQWYFLPADSRGVPIDEILDVVDPDTPLMIDLKCYLPSSAARILAALPPQTEVMASARNWWVLGPFRRRARTRVLFSCGNRWRLWWVRHITRFGDNHGVCVHERLLDATIVRQLQRKTPTIYSWGVTTTARCRELELMGLTGVILDDHGLYPPPARLSAGP